jgi:dipeptidase E
MGPIKERLLGGLPLVAFSAGTVLCGEDILTTNDINCCGCTQFAGLGLVDVNFNVHYPPVEGIERQERDSRLMEYQAFHDIPVIALEDGAYLLANEDGIQLIRGNGWLLKKGKPKTILSPQE